jgi:hypothetical protein
MSSCDRLAGQMRNQLLRAGKPVIGILGHQPIGCGHQKWGCSGVGLFNGFRYRMKNLVRDSLNTGTGEGRDSSKKEVEHMTKPIEIAPMIHFLRALKLLWGGEHGSGNSILRMGDSGEVFESCRSEVNQNHSAGLGIEQDVFGLDVPVDDAFVVKFSNSLGTPKGDCQGLFI